jgi:AcrR family transcriptional regulator
MASLPEHLSKAPVGRDRLPRAVVEAHQRDRILDASVAVFAKRGYQSTTIDHIVAAARIGVGSFYALFDGKEDCFIQGCDRFFGLSWGRTARAPPAAGSWPEQTAAGLRALLELIAAEPLRARIALVEVQTAGPAALALYKQTLDGVVPLLRRGRQFSPFAAELPHTLDEGIVGGLTWLLQQRLVTGEVNAIEALFPDLVEIVIAPYLGEDEAVRLASATAGATTALAG